ncbi:MAG: CYTH domain-containing protein [Muribaculaceae bacterium]|nr:CYTH domain-containing protein [Muribaculaceae bacterium]
MAVEIEHKYLVINDSYRNCFVSKYEIAQGYLSRDSHRTVRVRLCDDKACLTIKGITQNDSRSEYEYSIPHKDAEELLNLCLPHVIYKTRYVVTFDGFNWEIDEFHGSLEGLVIAEIELSASEQKYTLPPFVGSNVTNDSRFYNSNLSTNGLPQL